MSTETHETEHETVAALVARLGVTLASIAVPANPLSENDKWPANHWEVTLYRYDGPTVTHRLTTYFSKGTGLVAKVPYLDIPARRRMGLRRNDWENMPKPGAKGLTTYQAEYQPHVWIAERPTASEVLSCLILDAQGYDNARDFEDWAEGYGYDTDSRSVEKTWRTVSDITRKLRLFLGADYTAALDCETD